MVDPVLIWFRQDLRLADQAALAAAAKAGPVVALYVLDDDTPGHWRIGAAQRWWLHHSLAGLRDALGEAGVQLVLRRGRAADEVAKVAEEAGTGQVHALRHYEPWWRDAEAALAERLDLQLHDGGRLLPPGELKTGNGKGFRIFAPFWRALQREMPPPRPKAKPKLSGVSERLKSDDLDGWGLLPTKPDWAVEFRVWEPGEAGAHKALRRFGKERIARYPEDRNKPGINGSSELSPHLHHGELSPAQVWHHCDGTDAEAYLRELAWRDFTANQMLDQPDIGDENGRKQYDHLKWRSSKHDLAAWTKGETGYPIVDAGMRQLWQIGWLHNRARLVTSSFLVKHLLIDWREGARWYWDTLVDADYGNNSVNWQWVAGTGVDANQWSRILAPITQSERYEAADYIRKWVPELAELDDEQIHDPHGLGVAPDTYAKPLIGHKDARERALAAGKAVREA